MKGLKEERERRPSVPSHFEVEVLGKAKCIMIDRKRMRGLSNTFVCLKNDTQLGKSETLCSFKKSALILITLIID